MTNKRYPQRISPRLRGYDYSQNGAYFVTICTHDRAHWFGQIIDGVMLLNSMGQIAEASWHVIPDHYPGVDLDRFVVMPNHMHGIVVLMESNAALGTIIGTYKAAVTRQIRRIHNTCPERFWQGRYHDHIIRNEQALEHIRDYVLNNPMRWYEDVFYTL